MTSLTIKLLPDGHRRCGDCQACCKLLPMRETNKPANVKCQHQKFKVGCAIYPKRPLSCVTFACRWLTNDDTADLFRPDRSHCVVDPMPDTIDTVNDETGETHTFAVIQIWVDPRHRLAYREPTMRAYIERRGREGLATLIRWSQEDCVTVFPASIAGEWIERGGVSLGERDIRDSVEALGRSMRLLPGSVTKED